MLKELSGFAVLRLLAVLALVLADGGGAAAQEGAPRSPTFAVGGGAFRFLEETAPGAVVHATLDGEGGVSTDLALWLASPGDPLAGLDASFMTGLRPGAPSLFFRLGAGLLAGRDLIGPGFVAGVGAASRRDAATRLRVDGLFHWYGPRGGVPVLSLTAAFTPGRGR